MRLSANAVGLPTSILILLVSQTNSVQAVGIENNRLLASWPRDWTHVKDWIYGSASRKRDEELEGDVVVAKSPVGILKMSEDEGEKFYMEYWRFGDEDAQMGLDGKGESPRKRDLKEEARSFANSSIPISFRAPFALHTEDHSGLLDYEEIRARRRDSAAVLALLEKRDFKCPTGTSSCSSIGYPNSCCATGETCFQIADTGLGPVGCCPSGGNCGGTITNCASPNTPCAGDVGGGCCIPNYVCASVGCVINPSLVVIVTTTRTFTVVSSTPTTTTQTATITSTISPSVSSTVSQSSTDLSTTATTSASGVVPIRPTGDSSTATTTVSSTATQDTCPTGFYACSAHYQGGCCRTGRDCDTTSCPATSSTTIISSGITIAVPVGPAATVTSATGACATGWTSCAASLGGDCCPSGWACGTASCESVNVQATATTTAVLQKEVPGMGGRVSARGLGGGVLGLGVVVGWLVL